jgi:hypothetical protein
MKILEPQYKDDILKQLRHCDGTPAALHIIDDYLVGIKQSLARAADEIEKLRKENAMLRSIKPKNYETL